MGKYIGFWDMAETVLNEKGMEILRRENKWYHDACMMAHESWAERYNEYAISGTDDRPGLVSLPVPPSVRWIEQLVKEHNEKVSAEIKRPMSTGEDIPF